MSAPVISIQGYQGSFHHMVAQQQFGNDLSLLERGTFREVFADVEAGRAKYGVAAVKNTIAGEIQETIDSMKTFSGHVIEHVELPIEQHLIVYPGTTLNQITTIYSHPMAIKQCLPFLAEHPKWKIIETDDTAGSVKRVMAEKDTHAAAISSQISAEIYGAEILVHSIQAAKDNVTTFLILEKGKTNNA
jgi:prephenate dehydratase